MRSVVLGFRERGERFLCPGASFWPSELGLLKEVSSELQLNGEKEGGARVSEGGIGLGEGISGIAFGDGSGDKVGL